VSEIVKKILYTYKEDARSWERVSDWVERIGWPRFFEKCDLPFTKYLIDDWRGSRANLNASTHIRFEDATMKFGILVSEALHPPGERQRLAVRPAKIACGTDPARFFYHDVSTTRRS
jgi:hypothetical protein